MAERLDSVALRACAVERFTPVPAGKPVVHVAVDDISDDGISARVQTNLGADMSRADMQLAVGHLLHQLSHVLLGGQSVDMTDVFTAASDHPTCPKCGAPTRQVGARDPERGDWDGIVCTDDCGWTVAR